MIRRLLSIAFSALALGAAQSAQAQQVELTPGYITGNVSVGGASISSATVYASGPSGTSSYSANSGNYSITVSAPATGSSSYSVYAYAYTNNSSNYVRFPTQAVSVSQGVTSTANFALAPGSVSANISVTGGTFSYAYVYASTTNSGSAQGYVGASGSGTFPAFPGTVQLYGTAYLSNGTWVSLPTQTMVLTEGGTTNVSWSVAAPSTAGSISGTFNLAGVTLSSVNVYAYGPVSKYFSRTGNGPYSFTDLPPGTFSLNSYAYYDNGQSYLQMPTSAYNPSRQVSVGSGPVSVDINGTASAISGVLQLTGSKTLADSNYAYISAYGTAGAGNGASAYTQAINRNTGAYRLAVIEGDWVVPSPLYVSFYRPSPYWNAYFYMYDYREPDRRIRVGATPAARDLSYAVGTVTLTLRASGITFSSPSIQASCYRRGTSNETLWQYSAYASESASNVSQAPVTFVGPEGTCTINAYAYVNGSSTFFGQIALDVVAGSTQVIDIGGPSLVIQGPTADYVTSNSSLAVTGTATDDVLVASVTVNGTPAALSPPGGASSVSFSASLNLQPGVNEITTVATDGSGKQGTDKRNVYRDSGPPSFVSTSPADGTTTLDSLISVSGVATDDVLLKSATLNGNALTLASTNNAADPREVSFSTSVALQEGDNFITIALRDETPSYSTTRTIKVTRVTVQEQTITFNALADKAYGDAAFNVLATASSGLAVTFAANGQCTASGTLVTLTGAGSCTLTASQAGNAQYSAAPDVSRSFAIGKATPVLAWSNPADIVYGAALGATQLNATASGVNGSLAGIFVYTPAAGTVLNAGNGQTLSVSFTPNDTSNYSAPASKSVTINVAKATQSTVTVSVPSSAVYAQAGVAATASGGNGTGAYAYSHGSSTACTVNASSGAIAVTSGTGSCSITATRAGDDNYLASAPSTAATITVGRATPTVSFTGAPATAQFASSFSVTASSTGNTPAVYASSGSCSNVGVTYTITSGAGTCTATATWAADANYNGATLTQVTSAAPATTVTSVNAPSVTYDGASHGATASVSGAGGLSQALAVTYAGTGTTVYGPTTMAPTSAGTYAATASFSATTNYAASSDTQGFTIARAPSLVSVSGGTYAYDGLAHAASATVSGVGTGITQTVTWTYTPPGSASLPVNAGTYTATASYAGDANHLPGSGSASIVINPVPASIVYTGLETWSTSSATSTTATVTSSATVTASAGSVGTARVTFTNDQYPTGIPGCANLVVGAASGFTGSVACQWLATVPSSGANAGFLNTTVKAILLPGNFLATSDSDTVNVTQPNQSNFITGGGYLRLVASSGQYAGDAQTKSNFGFNVKYNKSGTNLQGNMNILVRKGTTVFQFKSNAMNNLTVKVPSATFTGKANLQAWDISDPTTVTSVAGNLTIQLQATDVADPGTGQDKLAITVWDANGGLLYSSAWNGSVTQQQAISGGNLQVR